MTNKEEKYVLYNSQDDGVTKVFKVLSHSILRGKAISKKCTMCSLHRPCRLKGKAKWYNVERNQSNIAVTSVCEYWCTALSKLQAKILMEY